jgi:hypothetical protein
MKLRGKSVITGLVVLAVVSTVAIAFAGVPIRGSSNNGTSSGAPTWLLLARTEPVAVTNANGKSVMMAREVVCPQQDVEASLSSPTLDLSGSCDSGEYLFIFQFTSASTNVTVQFNQLVNFVPDQTLPNYGALVCDDSDANNLEMCTNDPTGSDLPNITFSFANHLASFLVPSFPAFKGGTPQEGKGLTLFVLTQQTAPLPIHFPIVGIH